MLRDSAEYMYIEASLHPWHSVLLKHGLDMPSATSAGTFLAPHIAVASGRIFAHKASSNGRPVRGLAGKQSSGGRGKMPVRLAWPDRKPLGIDDREGPWS